MPQTVLDPTHDAVASRSGRWMTVIFNNATNNFGEVIEILIEATGCDLEEASIETWEADHYGQAPVHFAGRPECERAAAIISRIGVKTEVSLEWSERA